MELAEPQPATFDASSDVLPGGWRRDRDLTDHADQTILRRFEASRSIREGEGAENERATVWLVDPSAAVSPEAVRRDVLDRAAKLRTLRLPSVLAVREVYNLADGKICLIEEWGGEPLPTPSRRTSKNPWADLMFGRVLDGLAALHSFGVVHGSLVHNRVVGNPRDGAAWIAGTVVGGVPHASGNAYFPDGVELLPAAGPDRRTDVHAAILIGETLGATSALQLSRQKHADGIEAFDAYRIGHQFAHRRNWRSAAFAIGTVALVLIAYSGWSFIAKSDLEKQLNLAEQAARQANNEAVSVRTEVALKAEEGDRLRAELATADRRVKELEQRVKGADSPPDRLQAAKKQWTSFATGPDRSKAANFAAWWEGLKEKAAEAKHDADPATAEHLGDWITALRDVGPRFQEWLPHDSILRERAAKAATLPWDETAIAAVGHRVTALNEGAALWRKWAFSTDMTWPTVEKLIDAETNTELQAVLKDWKKQTIATDRWTLRLKKGIAPPGWGTGREVGVGSGSREWTNGGRHKWKSPTSHTYKVTEKAAQLEFDWSPGETIGVYLYGEWGFKTAGAARRLIAKEGAYPGPLALWRMNEIGRVTQNGFKLEFEIVNCPGPPPELTEPLVQKVIQRLAK